MLTNHLVLLLNETLQFEWSLVCKLNSFFYTLFLFLREAKTRKMAPVQIPLLADFLQECTKREFYDRISLTSLTLSIIAAAFMSFKKIPYGKTYTRNSSIFKFEVKDRLAVILINIPGPIIFAYSQIFYPNGNILSIPSILYIAHYIHRALIYPWFRKSFSKPWPLESVLYFFISNFLVALEISHTLIFGGKELNIYIQILVAFAFVAFAFAAAVHDYYLCSLRTSGDLGYKVPQGLLFKWVSGPNYLFEILQWCCYLVFFPLGLPLFIIGIWLLSNLSGRAESNHEAYTSKKKIFPSGVKYPEDRAPYIPFVQQSKYLI